VSDGVFTVRPVGHVRSTLVDPADAPRQGDEGAPPARIVVDPPLRPALDGLAVGSDVLVLTWLHRARRDTLTTRPRDDPDRPELGVFATRSPHRPNPIGLHRTRILALDDAEILVEHLEAVDGTPVLDLKPVLSPTSER
jgi:tRNA-Thr(GGU) m(6)t(6)A37 methyltransferase TsaA